MNPYNSKPEETLSKFSIFLPKYYLANLLIRLNYDEIKKDVFFKNILELYVNRDPTMMEIIKKIKMNLPIGPRQAASRIKHIKNKLIKENKIKVLFGLVDDNEENLDEEAKKELYSILEKDLPEKLDGAEDFVKYVKKQKK